MGLLWSYRVGRRVGLGGAHAIGSGGDVGWAGLQAKILLALWRRDGRSLMEGVALLEGLKFCGELKHSI